MGTLTYDGGVTQFEDRLLTHLQIVVVQRLRQNRSFVMSWQNALTAGGGRTSIWIHSEVNIRFTFNGSRVPALDSAWLQLLGISADGPRGLIVSDEQGNPVRSVSETA